MAVSVETPPLSIRLRESIGNRMQHRGVDHHTGVTAVNPDIFCLRAFLFDTTLPRHNTIAAMENRGERKRKHEGNWNMQAACDATRAAGTG